MHKHPYITGFSVNAFWVWEHSCNVLYSYSQMSLVVRKPVFGVSDQVQRKPGGTATEDGQRLEISDLGSRGIVLSV